MPRLLAGHYILYNSIGDNNGDTVTYVYDAMGNRREKQSVLNGATGYDYDANNRMTFAAGFYMNYDSCGNWIRKWRGDNPVTYIILSYDYENRLVDARDPGYNPYYMTNTYNGDGVRLSKNTNGDLSKKYVMDGMNTVVEQDLGGSLRNKYVYVNGMLLAKIDASDNKSYYHRDGLGTIVGTSNSTPAVASAQLFDEFGNWLYFDSNWDYYCYTGQEYDWTLTDALNLRAREYYPEYGRFMQEDPIGDRGGSLNWYLYTKNNPVNMIDPEGLKGCTKEEMDAEIRKIKDIAVKFNKSISLGERPFCGNMAGQFQNLINRKEFKCCQLFDVMTQNGLLFHNFTKVECSSCEDKTTNRTSFCVDTWWGYPLFRECPGNAGFTGYWGISK